MQALRRCRKTTATVDCIQQLQQLQRNVQFISTVELVYIAR
jgi:hypothetical protein